MNTKLNRILAEVSAGELIDKITILEIKKEKISDEAKLIEINKELKSLEKTFHKEISDKSIIEEFIFELKKINSELWDIEEGKRLAEKNKKFDDSFIQLSRKVFKENDKRAKVKLKINEVLGSNIKEVKSHY
tara:strand:+ start:22 stop:417 length:396 start_codon:yes stop_codon:yes gene_type:complete